MLVGGGGKCVGALVGVFVGVGVLVEVGELVGVDVFVGVGIGVLVGVGHGSVTTIRSSDQRPGIWVPVFPAFTCM